MLQAAAPADDGYGFVDVPTELPGVVSVAMFWLPSWAVGYGSSFSVVEGCFIIFRESFRLGFATRAKKSSGENRSRSLFRNSPLTSDVKAHRFTGSRGSTETIVSEIVPWTVQSSPRSICTKPEANSRPRDGMVR